MSAECFFCLQPLEDPDAEFCPGGACSSSYRLLFGKPEDAPPEDEDDVYEYDDRDTLTLLDH